MPLSSELVSKFAKLANNKPKEEKESTVYGTTVIKNGNKYVKLDGSESLTPASFTTNIADGERVTVLIKNHMAIVTGNITSPAARASEVEEVRDKADNASKTATNFLTYDTSNGVQLGNRSGGSWASFRAQITSAAFNILDSAGHMLASYGAKLIELGKNATEAVIMLCGGKGKIEYATVEVGSPELHGEPSGVAVPEPEYDNYLRISADKLRLQGDNAVSLYSNSGSIDNSHIEVSPSHVWIHSTGYISITSDSVTDVYGNPYLSVESGSSGNWHYKKWSNGDAELWMNYAIAGWGCSNEFGACYRTDLITMPSFPFKVYSPSLTVSYETDGYGAIPWAATPTTVNGPPKYYLVRPTRLLLENGKLVFHVLGKWKNI